MIFLKGFLPVLLLLILVLPLHAQTTLPADTTIEVYPYNDHFVRYFYKVGFTFNVLALYGDDGTLIVDTGFPLTAQQTLAAVQSKSMAPVTHVAISHTHLDHIGGLTAFPEATVIVAERGVHSGYFSLEERPTFTNPILPVEGSHTMTFNGETIEFVTLPMGHFKDEMTIRFVESNVIFIGSRVMPGTWPFVDPQFGDLDEVIVRPRLLAEQYPEVTFAVAHGPDQTAEQMIDYHGKLVASAEAVEVALNEGKSVEAIVAEGVLDPWDELNHGSIQPSAWVTAIARARNKLGNDAPLVSISKPLTEALTESGVDVAIDYYHGLKKHYPDGYDYGEAQLNQLGYELVFRDRLDDALKILELNAAVYDSSANVWDSIGEVHLLMGDTATAITYYEKALTRNNEFQSAQQVLAGLRRNVTVTDK